MTKTPEQKQDCVASQMAEEYCNTKQLSYVERLVITKGFIDGYQAANDQLADAEKVMNAPEKPDSWISVEERLPEESTHCVIRIDDGEYQVAWREDGHWIMFNPCCIYNSQLNNVTHWMPLPEPPEDK